MPAVSVYQPSATSFRTGWLYEDLARQSKEVSYRRALFIMWFQGVAFSLKTTQEDLRAYVAAHPDDGMDRPIMAMELRHQGMGWKLTVHTARKCHGAVHYRSFYAEKFSDKIPDGWRILTTRDVF